MTPHLSNDQLKRRAQFFCESADIYAVIDKTGSIVDVNEALLQSIGYMREDLIGTSFMNFVHEADIDASARELELIVKMGKSTGFLNRVMCKDGNFKLIEWDSNVSVETGEICSLGRDVSETRKTYDALNSQLSLQRAIIDSAEFSIISTDLDGNIQTYNRRAERLFGFTKSEVIAKMTLMTFFDEDEVDNYADHVSEGLGRSAGKGIEALLSKARAGLVEERNFNLVKKNGTGFFAHVSISAMSNEGECCGFLFIARDITVERRVESMKNEFISTVSHELRTPMTSIRGSLGLIAGGLAGEISTDARPLIEIAISSTDRLIRLVNDILDIEKIDSGKMEFKYKEVAIAPLLEMAIVANHSFAVKHNVKFRITKTVPNAMIKIDVDRFAQILDNLLSNAAKYTKEGDEIEVAMAQHAKMVRVSITDHGKGIPETFRPKVFGKFMQGNAADNRTKGGTGIGLAICKALVEQQGGSINFESEEGRGTTFFFEFPILENDDKQGSQA